MMISLKHHPTDASWKTSAHTSSAIDKSDVENICNRTIRIGPYFKSKDYLVIAF